jgi:hypothetical protein
MIPEKVTQRELKREVATAPTGNPLLFLHQRAVKEEKAAQFRKPPTRDLPRDASLVHKPQLCFPSSGSRSQSIR